MEKQIKNSIFPSISESPAKKITKSLSGSYWDRLKIWKRLRNTVNPMFVFASSIDYTPGAWIVSMKIYAYWILRKTKSFLSTSVGVCVFVFYMITHFILFSRCGLQCLNYKSESVLVLCILQSKCPFACWL